MGTGVGEAAAAEGAKAAGEAATSTLIGGTEVVGGAALTPGGASIAGLSALGESGAATYGAMEGLAAQGAASAVGIKGVLDTAKAVGTILSPVASLAQASAGVKASKGSSITNAPPIEPPVTMPIMGSPTSMNALRANLQEQTMRRGRASTILTSPDSGDKLGS